MFSPRGMTWLIVQRIVLHMNASVCCLCPNPLKLAKSAGELYSSVPNTWDAVFLVIPALPKMHGSPVKLVRPYIYICIEDLILQQCDLIFYNDKINHYSEL